MSFKDYDPEPDLSLASTIPARWYTDPAFLEFEKEKVFSKTWQPISRTELLQRPGDFHACEISGEPLVVTYGTDGKLHAMSNVCRHRAGPVAVGKGNRKSLQCRYHGWTYTLDGRLLTQPDFEGVKNWNKDEICLPPAAVESWGPFLYVNLKSNPMPLREFMGKINDEVQEMGVDLNKMRLIERRDYIVNCNWKVYIDNYLEGYHIPIAHPELFREVDYEQYRVDTFRYYSSANAPIRDLKPGDLHGRDRRYVRTSAESKALYYWIFPNWMINIYPDNLQFNHILPLDHQQTLTIFEWYFNDPGSAEGWESLNESIAFSDQIQKEDIEICEAVQRGLKSKTYDRGRFSVKRENGVHHFHMLLHEFLTAETQG
jgi:phenylpropionate dioxygenase-like ring-hydroxylating dioxygenase large terminal subunit